MAKWREDIRTPDVQAEIDKAYEKVKHKIESLIYKHCEDDIEDIPESKFDNFTKALADDVWYDYISQAYEDMDDMDIVHYAQEVLDNPALMIQWLYDENRIKFWADFFSRKKRRD